MHETTLPVVALALLAFWPADGLADFADDARMAEDALIPFVGSNSNDVIRQHRIDDLRQTVEKRVATGPSEPLAAVIVFSTGQSVDDLSRIATVYGLEILSIHLKTPLNDLGVIQSIEIGMASLIAPEGNFVERADVAIAAIRKLFLRRAELRSSDQADADRRVAYSAMLIYRCEVYGAAISIRKLLDEPGVAAAAPYSVERTASLVEAAKAQRNPGTPHFQDLLTDEE